MTSRTRLTRKEVDDVLGGEEAWKDADKTQASCDKCNHTEAYFYQLQIRSADEPMSTFYRRLSSTSTPLDDITAAYFDDILDSPVIAQSASRETPARSMFSVKRQLAAEAEWLQPEDPEDPTNISAPNTPTVVHDSLGKPTRFDWRVRALSRVRQSNTNDASPVAYTRRTRPPAPSNVDPAYEDALATYIARFNYLVDLEEFEDETMLRERLSQWPLERLCKEGYCILGAKAYWLDAHQFGRPVAQFSIGPGVKLPEHKFEAGMQVLLSRKDPLKEGDIIRGSIVSHSPTHIRVSFSERFPGLSEGYWRLDLGRPNLVYERIRGALSNMRQDPVTLENHSPGVTQYILEGTGLRDILLHTSQPPGQTDVPPPVNAGSVDKAPFQTLGAFKDDMRIVSWARRYSQAEPLVMEGDPPLDNLNSSQTRAMAAMIGHRMSLIQGPPGTGKTKTIIETVKLLKVHFEVPHPLLVCTYTNVAVDNLVEGLAKAGLKPLRVGFNGNVRQSLAEYSLDYKLQKHPLHSILQDLISDEHKLAKQRDDLRVRYRDLATKLAAQPEPKARTKALQKVYRMRGAFHGVQTRCAILKRKIYATQQQMLRDVVAAADVVCTTCVTAACAALNVVDFPVVFLDEASMSTEPASLIPITKGSQHVALIGDHKQLPPVIVSKRAREDGLAMSLFERLTMEGAVPSVMLDMQYRMHPDISDFPSSEFYNLSLMNGTVDAAGQVMPGLHPPQCKQLERHFQTGTMPSVAFIDHDGNECMKGRSFLNVAEAHIVASLVEDLLLHNEHLLGRDIGIIAPYVGQIGYLTRLFRTDERYKERFRTTLGEGRAMQVENIEIKTVDGFEGREKEVIIFSTVRNNSEGNIGFLSDRRRLNVGLTRAKRGLFVIGGIATLEACKKRGVGRRRTGSGSDTEMLEGDVWQRYAMFLRARRLVVSLSGAEVARAMYGGSLASMDGTLMSMHAEHI